MVRRTGEKRLQGEIIDRQDTRQVFEEHLMVEVKIIQSPEVPLRVGAGRLPDWLRHKKGFVSFGYLCR